jgi:hypothetical protein
MGRSGTSWVSTVLGTTAEARLVREPDGLANPYGLRAARRLGLAPVIGVDEPGPPELRRVFDAAYGLLQPRRLRGQQRLALKLLRRATDDERRVVIADPPRITPRLRAVITLGVPRYVPPETQHVVVKSTRLAYALDWVVANWQPTVVICRRHPLDVIASRLELFGEEPLALFGAKARARAVQEFGVEEPPPHPHIACEAWHVGVEMSRFDGAIARDPNVRVADHAELCADPVGRFRSLVDDLALAWTDDTEALVVRSNRPGRGYDLHRVAAEQRDRWRTRLTPEDVSIAAGVLAQFPIGARYDLDPVG